MDHKIEEYVGSYVSHSYEKFFPTEQEAKDWLKLMKKDWKGHYHGFDFFTEIIFVKDQTEGYLAYIIAEKDDC